MYFIDNRYTCRNKMDHDIFFKKVVIKIEIQSFEKIPRRTVILARVQVQLKLTINT